jgi:MoxR-like ATPase
VTEDASGQEVARSATRLGELTAAALQRRAGALGIRYPEQLFGQVVAALETGRHVMLVGPPGTGKTTLAHLAAELAGGPGGFLPATATGAWSTADTVGDTVPTADGPVFRPGVFVRALDDGRWLVIDEMNRAPIDAALGALFTVLAGQAVVLPHRRHALGRPLSIVPDGAEVPYGTDAVVVPPTWRIIATMNDFDKRTLHDLSYALMRRFTFIEVLAPPDDELAELVGRHGDHLLPLLELRVLRDIGPAVYLDAAEFAARRAADGCTLSRVRYEAIFAYLLPQLDGIDQAGAVALQELTDPLLAAPERDLLRRAVERVLGVHVPGAPGAHQPLH